MGLERRRFLMILAGIIALAARPILRVLRPLERFLPARFVTAHPARRYPGPVEKLDPAAVRRPGRWLG